MDVFISYAREDSDKANRLYADLMGILGVTPWLDTKKLLPGIRWKNAVMNALKRCDLIILLLSENSVSKNGFVQREITEALDALSSVPPDRIFVIPARLAECEPRHPELYDLQWVDLFPRWETGFDLIKKTIEELGNASSVPSLLGNSLISAGIFMETIISQENFERRLVARGEMRGCDAMEIGFTNLNVANRDLSGSNFVRCAFVDCNFQECKLRGVNFEGAHFMNCDFHGADLWGVNFWGANVRGIRNLDRARLARTNFFGTKMTNSQTKTVLSSPAIVQLGDYATFLDFFRSTVGMGEQEISDTFHWFNHRYFRMMFRKNTSPVIDWTRLPE